MKKGTPVRIKSNGHRASLKRAVYKNSKMAYVWDFDAGYDLLVPVKGLELADATEYNATYRR